VNGRFELAEDQSAVSRRRWPVNPSQIVTWVVFSYTEKFGTGCRLSQYHATRLPLRISGMQQGPLEDLGSRVNEERCFHGHRSHKPEQTDWVVTDELGPKKAVASSVQIRQGDRNAQPVTALHKFNPIGSVKIDALGFVAEEQFQTDPSLVERPGIVEVNGNECLLSLGNRASSGVALKLKSGKRGSGKKETGDEKTESGPADDERAIAVIDDCDQIEYSACEQNSSTSMSHVGSGARSLSGRANNLPGPGLRYAAGCALSPRPMSSSAIG